VRAHDVQVDPNGIVENWSAASGRAGDRQLRAD
jgi:hypothetical protein